MIALDQIYLNLIMATNCDPHQHILSEYDVNFALCHEIEHSDFVLAGAVKEKLQF